ncbi:MAG: type toxin-antitoxin system ParD family antitoxin [Devosia sp.]|uniref:type II toxin-antitoxin system ParD family antitoxin n=1 Tax=Devosia sp. TaxID=1871048 RepID=UPI00260B3E07|nr:type II toxin-antitoxin system ParD family antitoxin [Devosia sp.]MDB5527274.1 type toxin-antitoxin system ParD family antitoxin [Devosia sp.]
MSKVRKRTFSLTQQQSTYIDTVVASGGYASGSEVIREGIRILQERELKLQKWLKNEVAPEYDAWLANPDDVLTEEEVFDDIERTLDADEAMRKAS